MHRLAVEDVRAEDPLVVPGVVPGRPVSEGVLDRLDAVPLAIAFTDGHRQLVVVGLYHTPSERRSHDPGQPRAGAKFQYACGTEGFGAGSHVVGEGDGSGPERDSIWQMAPQFAEEVRLVRLAQDPARMQDGPGSPGRSEPVLM
ncbi:MAG TPA: hypothetical protein VLA19_32445 [Herpetosiphonaceae bacterium]|nr:hypothetical protein [Herpetosiphonaceae bacterium]